MPNPITDKYGNKRWYLGDRLHREDGPALEYADGSKEWLVNGRYHRLDGPACEYVNGSKYWYVGGKRHRLDGPAREYADGTKKWYVKGKQLSGPLKLLEHGAKIQDIAEYLTPREIAQCRIQE